MELINILILGGAIIFILILWIVMGVKHFQTLKREISVRWEDISSILRRRYDLVPNLVETVKFNSGDTHDSLLSELIKIRQKAVRVDSNTTEKLDYERKFLDKLNGILSLRKAMPNLAQDTNFLELKTDFDYLERASKLKIDLYNEEVKKYNEHLSWIFLAPIGFLFRLDRGEFFEV
jgi:LemA protein